MVSMHASLCPTCVNHIELSCAKQMPKHPIALACVEYVDKDKHHRNIVTIYPKPPALLLPRIPNTKAVITPPPITPPAKTIAEWKLLKKG